MGLIFDCQVEPNYKQFEISKEISKENIKIEEKMDKNKKNEKIEKKIKSQKMEGMDKKHKKEIKNKIDNKDNNKNMHTRFLTNNAEDLNLNEEDIIINTDEEISGTKKKTKDDTKINSNTKKCKKNIGNTIYINNSNVTISNRNNKEEENRLKETSNHEIKNEFNCFNTKDENIELDELINKVFSNNIKSSLNNSNNKNLLNETEISKDYFQMYSEQSQYNIHTNNQNRIEEDEKIINKLKEIKDKLNNKNNKNIKKKKKPKYDRDFNTVKIKHMSLSMNNRQIRKNIPTYRRNIKFSNNNIFSSLNMDRNLGKFKKLNYNLDSNRYFSLENSINKSLCSSLLCKSVRNPFYNASHNSNRSVSRKKKSINSLGKRLRETPSKYSTHQSYLNNSSLFNLSSNALNTQNISKNNKEKRLYSIVSKNIVKNKNKTNKKSSDIGAQLTYLDSEKENKLQGNSHLFYHQYRDIIEVDLPIKYNKESFINSKLSESNINYKIIFNYNKLNDFDTSIILYDGILYKVIDKKTTGFKISKRYFQITKNCFRYYNDIEIAKNENDKALVQFDIRHIKDIQIVDHDFLKDIKIDGKDIVFVFCIYLYQNDDFFVFAVNNENYGNSVFKILNLLKNYYEDKK